MIVIRNVFQLKFGKAREAVVLMEGIASESNCLIPAARIVRAGGPHRPTRPETAATS
jgi:hypothetical protein